VSKHNQSLEARAKQDLQKTLTSKESEYLNALVRVLDDHKLTREERDYVISLARLNGFSKSDCLRLHNIFLEQMAMELLVEDLTDGARITQLEELSRLLALPKQSAEVALTNANKNVEAIVSAWVSESPPSTTESKNFLGPIKHLGSSVINVGSQLTTSFSAITKLFSAPHQLLCDECQRETSHSVRVGRGFPGSAWLNVVWKAKSLSPTGFMMNAAVIAAADKQMLLETGKSLLPEVRCTECDNSTDSWAAAWLVADILRKKKS